MSAAYTVNSVEVGALRRSVGAAIEALVDLLDSLEPAPDLLDGSEASLEWEMV